MLNAYPDSMGGKLENIVTLLREPELRGAVSSFYILPSMFHTDLDRGFSVQDYELEETLVKQEDSKHFIASISRSSEKWKQIGI